MILGALSLLNALLSLQTFSLWSCCPRILKSPSYARVTSHSIKLKFTNRRTHCDQCSSSCRSHRGEKSIEQLSKELPCKCPERRCWKLRKHLCQCSLIFNVDLSWIVDAGTVVVEEDWDRGSVGKELRWVLSKGRSMSWISQWSTRGEDGL
jgi:hypothetical protein